MCCFQINIFFSSKHFLNNPQKIIRLKYARGTLPVSQKRENREILKMEDSQMEDSQMESPTTQSYGPKLQGISRPRLSKIYTHDAESLRSVIRFFSADYKIPSTEKDREFLYVIYYLLKKKDDWHIYTCSVKKGDTSDICRLRIFAACIGLVGEELVEYSTPSQRLVAILRHCIDFICLGKKQQAKLRPGTAKVRRSHFLPSKIERAIMTFFDTEDFKLFLSGNGGLVSNDYDENNFIKEYFQVNILACSNIFSVETDLNDFLRPYRGYKYVKINRFFLGDHTCFSRV